MLRAAFEERRPGDWHYIAPDGRAIIGMAAMCPCGCGAEAVIPFRGLWLDKPRTWELHGTDKMPILSPEVRFPCGKAFILLVGRWNVSPRP